MSRENVPPHLMCQLCQALDVTDLHARIGGRLQHHQLRQARLECLSEGPAQMLITDCLCECSVAMLLITTLAAQVSCSYAAAS